MDHAKTLFRTMPKSKIHSPVQSEVAPLSALNSEQLNSLAQKLSELVDPNTEDSVDLDDLLSNKGQSPKT